MLPSASVAWVGSTLSWRLLAAPLRCCARGWFAWLRTHKGCQLPPRPQVVSEYYGESEAGLRGIFAAAAALQPSVRGSANGLGGGRCSARVAGQLLRPCWRRCRAAVPYSLCRRVLTPAIPPPSWCSSTSWTRWHPPAAAAPAPARPPAAAAARRESCPRCLPRWTPWAVGWPHCCRPHRSAAARTTGAMMRARLVAVTAGQLGRQPLLCPHSPCPHPTLALRRSRAGGGGCRHQPPRLAGRGAAPPRPV